MLTVSNRGGITTKEATGLNRTVASGATRRQFVRLGAAWMIGAYSPGLEALQGVAKPLAQAATTSTSLAKAYAFLDSMMDLYAKGATLRLIQSYVPTRALNLDDTGFTYDNAATQITFLRRGQANDLTRAQGARQ